MEKREKAPMPEKFVRRFVKGIIPIGKIWLPFRNAGICNTVRFEMKKRRLGEAKNQRRKALAIVFW